MTIREDLHKLIDRLPESECSTAFEVLEGWLIESAPMLLTLVNAPEDDEPTTPEEDASAEEAWQEYLRGQAISAEEAKRALLP